jgi:hypothetical protein
MGNFLSEMLDLGFSGNFSGQQKPKHTFGKRLSGVVFRRFGKFFVTFGDCVTSESNSGLGVQNGNVMEKTHNVAHSSQGLVKSNLSRFIGILMEIWRSLRNLGKF